MPPVKLDACRGWSRLTCSTVALSRDVYSDRMKFIEECSHVGETSVWEKPNLKTSEKLKQPIDQVDQNASDSSDYYNLRD